MCFCLLYQHSLNKCSSEDGKLIKMFESKIYKAKTYKIISYLLN